MSPRVLGVDPSLTSTGIAYPDGTVATLTVDADGPERMAHIAEAVIFAAAEQFARADPVDLVVLEGFSYASKGSALVDLGGLGWIIRYELHLHRIRWTDLPPGTLKKYATGKGNAPKVQMVTAARERLGYQRYSHDEADALWLRAAGLDLLDAPQIKLPKTHLAALDGARKRLNEQPWPPPVEPYGWDVPTGERL